MTTPEPSQRLRELIAALEVVLAEAGKAMTLASEHARRACITVGTHYVPHPCPTGAGPPVLWAVHLHTLTDTELVAMPDRATAISCSNDLNDLACLSETPTPAHVTCWPYTPEQHHRALAELADDGFYGPYVRAVTP